MARNGYKIFDSDTHVGPVMDVLDKHIASAEKAKLPAGEQFKSANKRGNITYTKGQRRYRRRLGTAKPDETPAGYMAGFTGVKKEREVSPLVDQDPAVRASLSSLVTKAGWSAECFASASAFLTRPSQLTPACLVIEACHPDIDGLDLLRRIGLADKRRQTVS